MELQDTDIERFDTLFGLTLEVEGLLSLILRREDCTPEEVLSLLQSKIQKLQKDTAEICKSHGVEPPALPDADETQSAVQKQSVEKTFFDSLPMLPGLFEEEEGIPSDAPAIAASATFEEAAAAAPSPRVESAQATDIQAESAQAGAGLPTEHPGPDSAIAGRHPAAPETEVAPPDTAQEAARADVEIADLTAPTQPADPTPADSASATSPQAKSQTDATPATDARPKEESRIEATHGPKPEPVAGEPDADAETDDTEEPNKWHTSGSKSASLRSMFTVNDKFRFRRELFGNRDTLFSDALSMVEAMKSLEEVREYFRDDLGWNESDETVVEFISVIERYFTQKR